MSGKWKNRSSTAKHGTKNSSLVSSTNSSGNSDSDGSARLCPPAYQVMRQSKSWQEDMRIGGQESFPRVSFSLGEKTVNKHRLSAMRRSHSDSDSATGQGKRMPDSGETTFPLDKARPDSGVVVTSPSTSGSSDNSSWQRTGQNEPASHSSSKQQNQNRRSQGGSGRGGSGRGGGRAHSGRGESRSGRSGPRDYGVGSYHENSTSGNPRT